MKSKNHTGRNLKLNKNQMNLKIITQTKDLFKGKVDFVSVLSTTGRIGILPNHTELISTLDIGEAKITKPNGKSINIALNGGLIIVKDNEITILTNEAALGREIVEKEIEKAIEMAQKKMSSDLLPSELIQIEKQIRYQKLKKKVASKLNS